VHLELSGNSEVRDIFGEGEGADTRNGPFPVTAQNEYQTSFVLFSFGFPGDIFGYSEGADIHNAFFPVHMQNEYQTLSSFLLDSLGISLGTVRKWM